MAEPLLMLVTDRRLLPEGRLVPLLAEAARAGVDFIQVREKDLTDRERLFLLGAVREAIEATTARVLVNGRPDIATVAGAHGVQLPEAGLPVADVKRAFPSLLVGASCHSAEATWEAERQGADFVLLGPVFPTRGKEQALGLAVLAEATARARLPVFAIGGITPLGAGSAQAAGARGLAAIRAFVEAPVAEAVRAFRAAAR